MSEDAVFEFACFKVKSTDKAVLVVAEDTGTSYWIPKSQIVREDLFKDGDQTVAGILTVTEWIAREKGLHRPKLAFDPEAMLIDPLKE